MAGFFGQGAVAPLALKEQGTDAMEASTGASLGASFDLSLSENPTALITRSVTRSLADEDVFDYWKNYQDPAGRNLDSGAAADAEAGPAPSPKVLDPEALNERFKLPGLKYDAPLSEKTAEDIYQTHRTRLMREDVVKRAGGGVALGAAQLGASFLAGLLDPLNVAAAFIPIVPGAMVAARLSTSAARASLIQRTAIRAGVGAIEGAGGQALMEPGLIYLNNRELNDYGAAQVLQNLAFGATLGGIIRAGAGHLLDPRLPPEDIRAVAQAALAQVVDGRPVDVTALIDHVNAKAAAQRLESWHNRLGQVLGEKESAQKLAVRAETQMQGAAANRAKVIARTEQRIVSLRSEADALRAEVGEVASAARVQGILSAREEIPDVSAQSRLEGTQVGLSTALTRAEGEATKADATLSTLRAADSRAADRETAKRVARTQEEKIREAQSGIREEAITRLMEREIRQFADQAGVNLPPAEGSRAAKKLAGASKEDFKAAVALELNSIAKQSTLDEYRVPATEGRSAPPDTRPLRAQADEAAEAVGRQATTPYVDREVAQAQAENRKLIDEAVASGGDTASAIKEMQPLLDDAKAAYDIEVKAGRLDDEATKAELKQIADDEQLAKAEAEAVSCVARGMD